MRAPCNQSRNHGRRLAGAFLSMLLSGTASAGTPGPLELDSAVRQALEHHPALAQLRAEAAALHTVPEQAGALPDPTVSFGAANLPVDTLDLDQEPMTQIQLGVSQAIPFPGKRRLRREAAAEHASAADHRLHEQQLTITAEVRRQWWQLFHLDRTLDVVQRNLDLMRDLVKVAETRYSVGDGLQQDVLLAQLELSRLLNRHLALEGRRQAAAAELNALLNRPPARPIVLPSRPASLSLPEVPEVGALLTRANTARPLLAAQRDLLDAAGTRLDLSRREVYPDFKVGAGYGLRQGHDPLRGEPRSDFVSVTLSVNVPLYFGSKQARGIEQHHHEQRAARFMLDDALRQVETAITAERARYRASREQARLLHDAIVPQAEQTVASMLAGYQVGKVDFHNLVNSRIRLYDAQIQYWQSVSDAKQALAVLAAAVGEENLYE